MPPKKAKKSASQLHKAALKLEQQQDFEDAYKTYLKACKFGYAHSAFKIALLYFNGCFSLKPTYDISAIPNGHDDSKRLRRTHTSQERKKLKMQSEDETHTNDDHMDVDLENTL